MTSKFFRISFYFFIAPALFAHSAQADEAMARELMQRITTTNNELKTLEAKIGRESQTYARNLEAKQEAIKKLREQAASVRRLADEQLLGIDKLESRVEQWTTQSNYQKHLLNSYAESVDLAVSGEGDAAGNDPTEVVDTALLHMERALNPGWTEEEVILSTGDILKTPVLRVGPVEVSLNQHDRTGGLIVRDHRSEPRVLNVFNSGDLSELASLQANGNGYLRFDPTLGNAYELQSYDETLLGHVGKGGIWALPIVFFGLLSFVISLLKGGQFLKLPNIDTALAEKLGKRVAEYSGKPDANLKRELEPACASASPAQKKMIQIAVTTPVSQQRDDLLVAYLMEYKHKLERFMGVVGTSAAIAPLLGLLGTVSGMISTFKMMTIFGSGDASTVSGGISEALVTTELGLIVAIPSLVVSALLTRKAKSYCHKLETFAIKLSKISFAS